MKDYEKKLFKRKLESLTEKELLQLIVTWLSRISMILGIIALILFIQWFNN